MSRCPAIDELEKALSGATPDEAMLGHIETCPRCRVRARRVRENQVMLARLGRGNVRAEPGGSAAAMLTKSPGLAGYDVQGELHRGGQGVVYRAFQRATKRTVAIKVLLRGAFATSRQRHRFEREIEIVARLRHPNIVSIFESGESPDGSHYYVMEYVDGQPLDAYLERVRAAGAPLGDRLRLFCKICDAVSYAHQCGIIHRDLKPANILIDAAGEPHVLDFGLAKAVGEELDPLSANMTRTGDFLGTFSYAAPEQLRGASGLIDTRTDVYAIGVMLFEAVTGQFPYSVAGSLSAILHNISEVEPRRPSDIAAGIDDDLSTIILKALAKSRDRRYQSAAALRRDLVAFLSGEPIDAKRDSHWYMLRKTARRYRTPLAIGAGFLMLATGFAITMAVLARSRAQERDRAIVAERAVGQRAAELAAALSESRLERGRSLGSTGNVAAAEPLIWGEFLAPPGDIGAPDVIEPSRQVARRAAYWALWELYAAAPCVRTWSAQMSGRTWSALSGDGRVVLAFDAGGRWRRWNTASAAAIDHGELPPFEPLSVHVDQSGDRVVLLDSGRRLYCWDAGRPAMLTELRFPRRMLDVGSRAVTSVGLSSDGRLLAVVVNSRGVSVWRLPDPGDLPDAPELKQVAALHEAPELITTIAFNADSTRLIRGLLGGGVDLFDLSAISSGATPIDARLLWSAVGHRAHVRGTRFTTDNSLLATSGADGDDMVRVWDARTGIPLHTLAGHSGFVNTVEFRADGRQVISCGFDKTVRVWDPLAGRLLATLPGHADAVARVCYLPGTPLLASLDLNHTVKLWDTRLGGPCQQRRLIDGTLLSLCFSPDSRTLYVGCEDGAIRVLNVSDASQRAVWSGHTEPVSSLAISADGRWLASAGYDRTARVWDPSAGTPGLCRHVFDGHDDRVIDVAIQPDGRTFASSSDDGAVRVWDLESAGRLLELRGPQDFRRRPSVAYHPDGRLLAACEGRTDLALWSLDSGERVAVLTGHAGQVRCLAYSPDGRVLASAGDDATIRLWDGRSGAPVGELERDRDDVFSLAFSPDSIILASTGRGRHVKLWDVTTRKCLATLSGPTRTLFGVAFSPDGRSLAACGAEGDLFLWDLTYCDYYIAGNLDYWLSRPGTAHLAPSAATDLRAWAAAVLARPWPRISWSAP